jgi:hypothetical protein
MSGLGVFRAFWPDPAGNAGTIMPLSKGKALHPLRGRSLLGNPDLSVQYILTLKTVLHTDDDTARIRADC